MSAETPSVSLPRAVSGGLLALVAVGVIAAGVGLSRDAQRAWADLLLASYLFVEWALAAVFFIAVLHVSGAVWHTGIRRVPEAMARLLPVGAVGLLLVLILRPELYPWTSQPASGDRVMAFREAWLSRPFFLARSAAYLAVWTAFAMSIVGTSYRQDRGDQPALARRMTRLSAGFLVVLALTLVPASFDWVMSIEPRWYSTIFGFYDFASMFLGGLAAIAILVMWTGRLVPGTFVVSVHHRHDLGTLLFGFSTFWAYIWFCQFMLIWYGNIPEETAYFLDRLHGGWASLFWLNLGLNWVVPFVLLISASAKRRPGLLLAAAIAVCAGRLLDLFLSILPRFVGAHVSFSLTEAGIVAGAAGLFVWLFFRGLGAAPLVPARGFVYADGVGSSLPTG